MLIYYLIAIIILISTTILKPNTTWSILTYIQADNNLAPYANYNINDMELAYAKKPSDNFNNINLLIQWNQPKDNKTWRYKITKNGRIEDESVAKKMGINPAQEIIDSIEWIKNAYPADHYALILWNHGSGVEDYRKPRGILYDDSQNTCLTNPGLSIALNGVKQILGKNLDLLGMDACLMAMVEIAYQIKDSVDVLVASEETEPGCGWAYSGFLTPLILSTTAFTTELLAQNIITSYHDFYANNEPDFTLSALNINQITSIKQHIDLVVAQIALCKKYAKTDIKDKIFKARRATQTYAIDSYIDLYSFYSELIKQCNKSKPKSAKILNNIAHEKTITNSNYTQALQNLNNLLIDGQNKIKQLVFANTIGTDVPASHGISIYYPSTSSTTSAIHSSYAKTQFAQESKWLDFIQEYRN